MANLIREALTADQQPLFLYTGGMSKVGFGVTGTWVGSIAFTYSTDGIVFNPLFVTPFATGTAVQVVTANGNWEALIRNIVAVRAVFSRTSGTAVVVIGASLDSSYQDAFLAATSKYVSQSVGSGATNVVTIAAQANRAWRCRTLSVGFSVAASAAVDLKITDGASSVLWEGYVPPNSGASLAGGGQFLAPLPTDPNTPGLVGGGVVGTPGNSMVITLAAPGGSVVSTVNAEMAAA